MYRLEYSVYSSVYPFYEIVKKLETQDNFLNDTQRSEHPIYSVSELSHLLKQLVENNFDRVQVRGEISGAKLHTSGHLYFAIKDAGAVMDAVCWRGSLGRIAFAPQDGMEVICHGRLSTFPGRSKYQMIVERMEMAGEGALLKLLEERKRRLAAEGLFDVHRKKVLPFLPKSIGIITSPTGAVIQDMLHRLQDRFPCPVLLWPVLVQGEGAAQQIAAAIHGFNILDDALRPDLLIVARGGGSLEDLWAFNEEIVVRAAAASNIPLISGVGHEPDYTLIDFAADHRAPTPTAAAERAVPVRIELRQGLLHSAQRLERSLQRGLDDITLRYDEHIDRLQRSLPLNIERWQQRLVTLGQRLRHPLDLIDHNEVHTNNLYKQLHQMAERFMDKICYRLERATDLLRSYSFESTLQRGFALIRTNNGQILTSKDQCSSDLKVNLTLHDGNVTGIINPTYGKPQRQRPVQPIIQPKLFNQ